MRNIPIVIVATLFVIVSCAPSESEPPPVNSSTTTAVVTNDTQTSTASDQPDPPFTIDHFKFWELDPSITNLDYEVPFRGQFDDAEWSAKVASLTHLANPVKKNNEKILDSKRHLLVYSLQDLPQRRREVTFRNQFTKTPADPNKTETWIIGNPKVPGLLLMPAGKERSGNPGWPDTARPYVCYGVERGDPVRRVITLLDQFDKPPFQPEKPENLTELIPEYFCVPALRPNEQSTGNDHLVIYKFIDTEQDERTPPIRVVVSDRFHTSPRPVRAKKSVKLAVPSFKTGWKFPQSN